MSRVTPGDSPNEEENPYRFPDGQLKIPARASSDFDPAQAFYEDEMKTVANDVELADRKYDEIPESHGGRVIGTDIARELLPEYAKDREGKLERVMATGRVAQAYAKDRLWREIAQPGQGRRILFTAGGVAAGKSTSISQQVIDEAALIFDGTLRETEWARAMIEKAIAHGWLVQVVYVQRPLDLAAQGAIDRAQRSGRWGKYAPLPGTHQDAQRSIIALGKYFDSETRVEIAYMLNDSPIPAPARFLSLAEIDIGAPTPIFLMTMNMTPQQAAQDPICRAMSQALAAIPAPTIPAPAARTRIVTVFDSRSVATPAAVTPKSSSKPSKVAATKAKSSGFSPKAARTSKA